MSDIEKMAHDACEDNHAWSNSQFRTGYIEGYKAGALAMLPAPSTEVPKEEGLWWVKEPDDRYVLWQLQMHRGLMWYRLDARLLRLPNQMPAGTHFARAHPPKD